MKTISRICKIAENIKTAHDARTNSICDIRNDVSALSEKTQTMMKEYKCEHKWMAIEWARMEKLLKKRCEPRSPDRNCNWDRIGILIF